MKKPCSLPGIAGSLGSLGKNFHKLLKLETGEMKEVEATKKKPLRKKFHRGLITLNKTRCAPSLLPDNCPEA
jgi:hypothetical protein